MIFSKIFVLMLCYRLGSSQTETDVYVDIENDLLVFDFIYGCLAEYSENVVVSLNDTQHPEEKHQISEECKFYPGLKHCLQPRSGNTYVDDFISALDGSMGFCACLNEDILVPTTRLDEAAYCKLCQEQVVCLQPYSSNPFLEELLSGLDIAVKSKRCIAAKEKERKKEEERKKEKTEDVEANQNHHSVPEGVIVTPSPTSTPGVTEGLDAISSPCADRDHPIGMTFSCAHWLHTNYHSVNSGWKPCSDFTGSYKKNCGYYWAKCKKSGKTHNKNCCISIHCYGGLGK